MKQYLELVQDILFNGYETPQRAVVNGQPVSQLVLPGLNFRHDMKHGFPLLTTKKMPLRLIAVELEWFLQGRTDKEFLEERDVHIWDEWGDRNGKLGPVYGRQWRHFSKFINVGKVMHKVPTAASMTGREEWVETGEAAYVRSEIDQLKELVEGVRKDPFSRRHRVTAWNPAEIDQMALPTCHTEWQTVVGGISRFGKRILHLCMNQRSADMMLGVPFNIASYALLHLLLAKELDMEAGILDIKFVNAHIYGNHIDAAKEQVERSPRILPEVTLPDVLKSGKPFSIYDWTHEDLTLFGYKPYKGLKMDVAV
jgi:thymidylate synthase